MDVGVLARRRRGAGERLRRGAHQLRRVRLEREVHVVSRDLHPNPRGVVGFLLPPRGLHDGHERRVPRDGSMHPSSRPNRSRRRPRTITTRGGACPRGRGRERGFAGRVRAARSRGRAVDTAPTDAPRVVASAPPRREPLGEEETHLSERQLRLESRGRRRFGLGPIFISALARKKLTRRPSSSSDSSRARWRQGAMPLPPRELALWPLRAALSSGLASLLSLAQSTVFSSEAGSNVLSSPVFGTVVAIVCSTKTRGEVVGTAWGVLGGACMGCVLSALCAALFGPSLGAVLFSNALVGALVLYPRRFPVLAQKFAFGASTLMLWAVFEGADLRWSTLGVPICTAYGAARHPRRVRRSVRGGRRREDRRGDVRGEDRRGPPRIRRRVRGVRRARRLGPRLGGNPPREGRPRAKRRGRRARRPPRARRGREVGARRRPSARAPSRLRVLVRPLGEEKEKHREDEEHLPPRGGAGGRRASVRRRRRRRRRKP